MWCSGGGGEGVDGAKAEFAANKLTVVGKVDPSKLREMLAEKTKKKVDLISPQPSKKDENKNDNKKKADENDKKKKPDEKKPKDKEVFSLSLSFSLLFFSLSSMLPANARLSRSLHAFRFCR